MSVEDGVEDKAKDRAEERAERELQLKIDTLELEQEKFKFTYWQGYADRFAAAALRGTTALIFANGTSLVLFLTSRKSLLETFPADTLKRSALALFAGFVVACISFVSSLILSGRPYDYTKKTDLGHMVYMWTCAIFAMASFASLCIALLQPVVFLKTH